MMIDSTDKKKVTKVNLGQPSLSEPEGLDQNKTMLQVEEITHDQFEDVELSKFIPGINDSLTQFNLDETALKP